MGERVKCVHVIDDGQGPVSESESESENGTRTLTPGPLAVLARSRATLKRRAFARAIVRPPAYNPNPRAHEQYVSVRGRWLL